MTEVVMMELVFNDPRFLWDQTPLGLGQVAHSRNTLIQTWEQSSSIERYFIFFFCSQAQLFSTKKRKKPKYRPGKWQIQSLLKSVHVAINLLFGANLMCSKYLDNCYYEICQHFINNEQKRILSQHHQPLPCGKSFSS